MRWLDRLSCHTELRAPGIARIFDNLPSSELREGSPLHAVKATSMDRSGGSGVGVPEAVTAGQAVEPLARTVLAWAQTATVHSTSRLRPTPQTPRPCEQERAK